MKEESIFKKFGPAFLILALGIGSGEFILWPYLSANYGFGILWGALLGISLQLFLINIISRNTIIFKKNILEIFSLVFPWIFFWIIFSTIIGFGWPGFASLTSNLVVDGLGLATSYFLPLAIFILILAGGLLIFSKSAYKKILAIEKVAMTLLFLLTIFLFIYYFQWSLFKEMLEGFVGIGSDYLFIPNGFLAGAFLATFLGAVAYAGSGGNLLLANSFYLLEEKKVSEKGSKKEFSHYSFLKIKNIFKQNLLFFWGGGLLIISMLSYISYAVLKNVPELKEDFSFLILESQVFSNDLGLFVGYSFIILGAMAIFGVQMGILDFIGRIFKHSKNSSKKFKEKISDLTVYKMAVAITVVFGLLIFLLGVEKPKTLIVTGAVINAFSMGIIALLLFLVEWKEIPLKLKSKKVLILSIFSAVFYFAFFTFVLWQKVF